MREPKAREESPLIPLVYAASALLAARELCTTTPAANASVWPGALFVLSKGVEGEIRAAATEGAIRR